MAELYIGDKKIGGNGGEDVRIGDMESLTTTNKETIVQAVNEVNGKFVDVD